MSTNPGTTSLLRKLGWLALGAVIAIYALTVLWAVGGVDFLLSGPPEGPEIRWRFRVEEGP
jgi:hypothetical protein